MRQLALLLLLTLILFPADALAQEKGSSGLPLPRFAALRHGEVNLRTGPGVRYPIDWVYQVRDLPVEIVAEFDNWRKIRDSLGAEGWVHLSVLSGRRYLIITMPTAPLMRDPSAKAPVIANLEKNTLGRLISCQQSWCKMEVSGFRGWVEKNQVWGVYANEVIN